MCDYFDDFEDDFMDDDSFEDSFEEDLDDRYSDDNEPNNDPDESESKDDFTAKDAFFIGGAMGFAYEEGLRGRKRRKRKLFGDDSD